MISGKRVDERQTDEQQGGGTDGDIYKHRVVRRSDFVFVPRPPLEVLTVSALNVRLSELHTVRIDCILAHNLPAAFLCQTLRQSAIRSLHSPLLEAANQVYIVYRIL